jgi:hypothetical protein
MFTCAHASTCERAIRSRKSCSQVMPADGLIAAAENRTFGTARWQLKSNLRHPVV